MLYLISLLSFLLPFQLGIHFDFFNSTVYGFKIDYLIPALYLTDIIAILIIVFGLKKIKITKQYILNSILFLVFILINVYLSEYKIASIYKWIKFTEMLLLGFVIKNTKRFDIFNNFLKPLSYSVLISSILAGFQFFNKGSIGGIFYFLGERAYQFSSPNIAPYPYSTFSHSNSFAGFLLVFGILLLQYRQKFKSKYFWLLSLLVVVNLFLTNSLNVYITAILIFLLSLVKLKKGLPLMFIDLSARYISHRIELIKAALAIIKENFLFGVGLNNFIPNLVRVSNSSINSWELQPVHNIFLLVLAETGIFGLLVFISLILPVLSISNYPLIAIIITGLSDHYWLTLQQNMLLFTYVISISKKWKTKK